MELAVIVISLLTATVVSLLTKKRRVIAGASLIAASIMLVETALIALRVSAHGTYQPFPFVSIDAISAIVVLIVGVVGFFATLYSIPYLAKEADKQIIGSSRIREYYVLLNLFLAVMLLSVSASQPVVAWIFLEATTLSTAFLISFYNKASTIEAAWKYLIINSTGLLLGFFGTILYFTSLTQGQNDGFVSWQTLLASASHFDPVIAKVAFIFVLIGYGTKAGLAPMHTWKPDAYSKAPAPIGALFSGALLPVAFVTLLKFKAVTDAAVGSGFSRNLFIAFAIGSILIAAFSILSVRNYKRLLAYSSIEHIGIMCLGFGFGGIGIFAALLHTVYHSLIKSALFFLSGNFMIKYHSAKIANVVGALETIPTTSVLFLIGFFAITGLPPFGLFLTEVLTFSAGAKTYLAVTGVALLAIVILFLGFLKHVNGMVFGPKPTDITPGEASGWLIVPPFALLALAFVLSLHLPAFLLTLINEAASRY